MNVGSRLLLVQINFASDVFRERTQSLSAGIASVGCLLALSLICFAVYRLILAPYLSANKNLPTANQGPVWKRLFSEPNSIDFLRWTEEIPNQGLIRFYGILNGERLLITTTSGTRVIHDGDAKDFHRHPAAQAILTRLTGGGLFAAEGREHTAQRKELTPAFKHRHLKELYPTFWKKTVELVQSLQRRCKDSPGDAVVDVDDWFSRGTLDAIGLAGFGFDFNSIAKPYSELVRKYRTGFLPGKSAARVRLLANIIPMKLLFRLPMKQNRNTKACIQAIRGVIHTVVQRRQAEPLEKRNRQDMLAVILDSPLFKNNTDLMVSQCMAFLAAGHEASALALSWTLFELSKDDKRQQKLRTEIRAHLPSPSSGISVYASQIDRLEYLEAVVKESLRKWAPVPRQTRICPRAVKVAGHIVPKNTPLVVSHYAMNRMQENWGPDAAEFRPERWLGEAKAFGGSMDRYCFSTFSHGARSCIGQRFAHYEVLVFLAGLVGAFKWSFVNKDDMPPGTVEADHDSTIMLKVVGGLQLALKEADGW